MLNEGTMVGHDTIKKFNLTLPTFCSMYLKIYESLPEFSVNYVPISFIILGTGESKFVCKRDKVFNVSHSHINI